MTEPEFNKFAERYRELHDANIAISGENSEYFVQYKARWLKDRLGSSFSGKLLDYGCGTGRLLSALHILVPSASLSGYDVSNESINAAKSAHPKLSLLTDNRSQLSPPYDCIVVANVLHHICPVDRVYFVEQLSSLLSLGGKIFMFEHNPINPATRWVVSKCEFDVGVKLLPITETVRLLQQSQLTVTSKEYIVFFPRAFSLFRFLEPKLWWLPAGAQYVVTAIKKRS